jgi:Ca2+-transporting ATPase
VDVVDAVRGDGHPPEGGWTGLSAEDAAARLAEVGPNEVITRHPVHLIRRILGQLRDPLTLVLLAAAALTVLTGDHADTLIIVVVVVVNTVVGVAQEIRADAAVAALTEMTAPTARVVRGGTCQIVPARDVVPGDVLELGEGDIVPADAELIESASVLVDEQALTGEAVPVDKGLAEDGLDGTLRAGTVIVRGRAVARATATGPASAMGRIAALLDTRPTLTPLQRRLVGLGRWLAGLSTALCLVVLVLGLARGESLELMAVTAVSLLVAAVPESLPAVVTLSLALGARRMTARQAIVRRLPAVETLGSVTVIATDKTGTLTEGNMVVEALWTPTLEATVTGRGYAPHGQVLTDTGPIMIGQPDDDPRRDLVELLRAGVLCCDARLAEPVTAEGTASRPADDVDAAPWTPLGDPTEAAVLAAAGKVGLDRPCLEARFPRVAELPFDSGRRRMTTVHRRLDAAGRSTGAELLVVCKGAPDLLHPPLVREDDTLLAAARQRAAGYAADGYRVLAVVAGERPAPAPGEPPDWERDLHLLGLIAIADPPRPAAAATVAACRNAGITPVLITGDHVATARAVAVRLGLASPGDAIVSGRQLATGEVPDPTRARVFARTSPEQKLDIVQAWRSAGHVVAMTGDGVNDGPALRRADIGVAMGRRGTEVARQAADLVLADDDLATVVAAVEEGRRVYSNVRRFLLYALSGGVAEILVMLAGPFVGLPLPLLPAQILWVNLITHGMPGVAFGAEPATEDAMRRPPRPPNQSVLGDGLWQRIGRTSTVIALVTLAVGVWARGAGVHPQSMVFLTLAAAQLAVALGVRARPGGWSNPALLLAVAGALALQLGAVYLPPLQDLLGTRALGADALLLVLLATLPGYLLARLDRLRSDRRHALRITSGDPEGTAGGDRPIQTAGTAGTAATPAGGRAARQDDDAVHRT